MNFFTFTFEGVRYDFRLSYGAKREIELAQKENAKAIKPEDMAKILALRKNNEIDFDNMSEDDISKILEIVPSLNEMPEEIDAQHVAYILLKNHKDHRNLTWEKFEDIVYGVEEQFGFEESERIFKEISEKTFLTLAKLGESHKEKE